MEIDIFLLALATSYLIGSLSFGRIVTRLLKPETDLDNVEMPLGEIDATYKLKSIGGNTVSMRLGARAGCLVGFLDIFKAFLPTLVFKLLYPEQPYFLVAAIGAFIGHVWPVYYKFKGGRGISPFYGGLITFNPLGAISIAFLSMFIGMVVFKELIIAYAGGVLLTIPWFLITERNDPLLVYYLIYGVLINILFITAMLPEIKQMRELRRKYGKPAMAADMSFFPMGQHMLRLMDRLGLSKKPKHPKERSE